MARDEFDRVSKRGDPVTAETFNEFRREMRRNRLKLTGPGLLNHLQTPGGLLARVGGGTSANGTVVRIKTTSVITARSGTTPGTGTGVLVDFDGTDLADGSEITLRNLSGKTGGAASGKYGFASKQDDLYWLLSVEC